MKLPDKIFGVDTGEAYKKFLEGTRQSKRTPDENREDSPLEVKTNLVLHDYIRIPGTNIIIGRETVNKNLTWENIHYALADNGLFMPTPALFTTYFMSVKDAAERNNFLYAGDHKPLSREETQKLWNYLSSTTNRPKRKRKCWTWLDAAFEHGTGQNQLDMLTDHRVVVQQGKKVLQARSRNPLENCVDQITYVHLAFNKQGLPTQQAKTLSYHQGETLYFWKPVDNRVARFVADSVGAGLSCVRNPQLSFPALGVFACAEGTLRSPRKKK